jgi:hypothetical protein
MDKVAKVVAAITALVIAVGTLVAALGIGRDPAPTGTIIILDSPEAYMRFLENHPAG